MATVKVNIDDNTILSLLIGAFEGGSSYWLREGSGDYARSVNDVNVSLVDDETGKPHTLTPAKIKIGLAAMASKHPQHFGNILTGDDDNCTADAFLQCCVFGSVIYG